MFQKTTIFFIIFLATVIQTTIIPQFFPFGLAPNLILVMVIFWTVHDGFERMWPRILLSGFLLDLTYQWVIGLNIISLMVISFGTSYLAKRFLISQKFWRGIIIISLLVLGTIINGSLIYILVKSYAFIKKENIETLLPVYDWKDWFILMFNNALLMVMAYWPLKKMGKVIDDYTQRIFNQNRVFQKR